jgi:hypothetical protein
MEAGSVNVPGRKFMGESLEDIGAPTRPPNAAGSGELFPNLPAPNDEDGELDAGDEEAK